MPQFTAALMGVNFRGTDAIDIVKHLQVGFDQFEFRRDPENQYDANAIEVHAGDEFIGFVAKEVAEEIAPLMDSGYAVTGRVIDFLGTIKPNLALDVFLEEDEEDEEDESEDDESEEDENDDA